MHLTKFAFTSTSKASTTDNCLLTLAGTGAWGDASPLGFSENNSRTDRPIAAKLGIYLFIELFYIIPENFQTVPIMTFHL